MTMRRVRGVEDPLVTPIEYMGYGDPRRPVVEREVHANIAHNLCVIAVRLGELTEALHAVEDKSVFEKVFGK